MISIDQALLSIGLASLSFFLSYYMIHRNNMILKEAVTNGLKVNSKAISSWIEANKGKIQRAHSIIGSQGADANKLKQGEKLLNAEIYRQSPILDAVKSFVSPTFSQWMEDNPDIVMELAPRIQQIMSNMPQNAEYTESSESRPHPFGLHSEE
jgi:hypothetical protein